MGRYILIIQYFSVIGQRLVGLFSVVQLTRVVVYRFLIHTVDVLILLAGVLAVQGLQGVDGGFVILRPDGGARRLIGILIIQVITFVRLDIGI
ncbi:hypothetical protein SDC9_122218 [bioreactor metagenome]|uniref:Uncharacterized protein n=1 Tax=bioreactor metagenome TaxID=1076179 RepID=A0A645CE41_9ZZZZ